MMNECFCLLVESPTFAIYSLDPFINAEIFMWPGSVIVVRWGDRDPARGNSIALSIAVEWDRQLYK
jgi:hypothetical protein